MKLTKTIKAITLMFLAMITYGQSTKEIRDVVHYHNLSNKNLDHALTTNSQQDQTAFGPLSLDENIRTLANVTEGPSWKNVVEIGGDSTAVIVGLEVDRDGSIYLHGEFHGELDFFGESVNEPEPIAFVSKLNRELEVEWLTIIDGKKSHGPLDDQLVLDKTTGNIYISGKTISTNLFFIAQLSASGEILWTQDFPEDTEIFSVSASNGLVCASGTVWAAVTIDGVDFDYQNSGDACLFAFDTSGDLLFGKIIGGTDIEYQMMTAMDKDGNIFAASEMHSADIIDSDGNEYPYQEGDGNNFLIKIDAEGVIQWHTMLGGAVTGADYQAWFAGLTTDLDGNVIVKGWFGQEHVFGDDTLESTYTYNKFIAKYSSSGEELWAKSILEEDYGFSYNEFETDSLGNIYFMSEQKGNVYIEGLLYEYSGNRNAYVAKFSPEGNFEWLSKTQTTTGFSEFAGLGVLSEDEIVIGGRFRDEAFEIGDFDFQTTTNRYKAFIAFLGKHDQNLDWSDLSNSIAYGSNITLSGSTTEGLSVVYESSNESVAQVSANEVRIVGVGEATITAYQSGTITYNPLTIDYDITSVPAVLTMTIDSQSRIYGASDPDFTASYTGFKFDDTIDDITIPEITSDATITSGVGSYVLSASGGNSNLYEFDIVNGTLTIEPAALQVTASDLSMSYGSEVPELLVSYDGFVNSDDATVLTASPEISTSANSSSVVGDYEISVTGGDADNYTLAFQSGTLSVERASLTVEASSIQMTYGSDIPDLEFNITGYVNDEDISVITTSPVIVTTASSLSNAGAYDITVSGGSSDNYDLTYVNGILTIDKALLSVSVEDAEKLYGGANPDFVLLFDGYVKNDGNNDLTTMPEVQTDATELTSVGEYDIEVSGGESENYSFDYSFGTLTISKAPLTVTAEDQEMVYGSDLPAFTFNILGFVNDDTEDDLDALPKASTSASKTSVPGAYEITVSGGDDNNYEFSYENGQLLIIEPLKVSDATLEIYPNPVKDFVTIKSAGSGKVIISNAFGQIVKSLDLNKEANIDLSNLSQGIYIMTVEVKEGRKSWRIIKE